MNGETKMALACLALMVVGAAMIFAGVWPNSKLASVVVGVTVMVVSGRLFAAIWRDRP